MSKALQKASGHYSDDDPCVSEGSSDLIPKEGIGSTTFSQSAKLNEVFRPVGKTTKTLPSDIYEVDSDSQGLYFTPVQFPADTLMRLPGMPIDYIMDQIRVFWDRERVFTNCGLLHKRGVLLYGPAGCGKTSIIRLLCNDIIERDGVVLLVNGSGEAEEGLGMIRKVEPRRPILTIIEDIETYVGTDASCSSSAAMLALLDGETQVNHVVHLATTNKPEELEDRILKRPGRFDLVIGLNPPIAEARYTYLKNLVKDQITEIELRRIVRDTEGLGLAHLREFVVASICLDLPQKETLERLRGNVNERIRVKPVGSKRNDEVGFTTGFKGSFD